MSAPELMYWRQFFTGHSPIISLIEPVEADFFQVRADIKNLGTFIIDISKDLKIGHTAEDLEIFKAVSAYMNSAANLTLSIKAVDTSEKKTYHKNGMACSLYPQSIYIYAMEYGVLRGFDEMAIYEPEEFVEFKPSTAIAAGYLAEKVLTTLSDNIQERNPIRTIGR